MFINKTTRTPFSFSENGCLMCTSLTLGEGVLLEWMRVATLMLSLQIRWRSVESGREYIAFLAYPRCLFCRGVCLCMYVWCITMPVIWKLGERKESIDSSSQLLSGIIVPKSLVFSSRWCVHHHPKSLAFCTLSDIVCRLALEKPCAWMDNQFVVETFECLWYS